ncbi:MAG: hypothetical protein DLM66_04130 [Candidatus Dormiibacter spiritus]|nr:MAG: hypothetical protein DLM66_04130 [Candidatus Dormibacteraeota bacterium]
MLAPRASAIAGELEGLTPLEVLTNPTKLAKLLGELVRGAALDVAWVESGSRLAHEVAGCELDWSAFPPVVRPRLRSSGVMPSLAVGRPAAVLEVARRLRATLGEAALVGIVVPGPSELASECVGLDPEDAAEILLVVVRAFCEAGTEVVMLTQGVVAPEVPDYTELMRPLVSTVRFFRALPLVSGPSGEADWCELANALGAIPCVLPGAVWSATGNSELHALALPVPIPAHIASKNSCVLVTTEVELTGIQPVSVVGELQRAIRKLDRGRAERKRS